MKTRRFGGTGLELSVLGLGTWAMGGPDWPYGWGPQDEGESIAAIRRALFHGINWIDTAPVYGLGYAEEVVARALADVPPSDRPLVFTKCGLVWKGKRVEQRLGGKSIRREAEASLRRLGVDVIDLYQIHWPNSDTIVEAWRTLVELRREGKVRHIGVSNFDVSQLERLRPIAPVETFQPPYSLVRREIEKDLLPHCLARDIGVIVYSPLESGLLSGTMTRERIESLPDSDWRKRRGEEFREPKLTRNLALADRLRAAAALRTLSAAALAVAWTLKHPAVTGAIVGARRPEQVDEIVRAAEIDVTDVIDIEVTGC
ncbi:MAG TPA: aldo/keto reductase [Vicinamibacteria bacterium]|nr:aldo/keto reductase [Vicinamibacteria bacterium]